MIGLSSNLTYEEYAAWCASRLPAKAAENEIQLSVVDGTIPAPEGLDDDSCPPTVRSERDRVVITPRKARF